MIDEEDKRLLILLSGPVAAGKSSFVRSLQERFPVERISSGQYLLERVKDNAAINCRFDLQEFGDQLDLDTDYAWVYWKLVLPIVNENPGQRLWALDSVRKPEQVQCLRECFSGRVFHVHITASEDVLRQRYMMRRRPEDTASYLDVCAHPNEISARGLIDLANFVLENSEDCSIEEQLDAFLQKLRI